MLAEGFKYRGLIKYFEEISAIPRATFSEERIAEYIYDFAKARGLFAIKDSYNNVFVRLPASQGRENENALLLQGHTDMVCEKNADSDHDFDNDGIDLYESDGYIRARGTTLGADNGVAVAIMLYILDGAEGNIKSHPTIECLFTASEEKGMVGASNFDYSIVTATSMINMDSADEREIIVGCAGAQRDELRIKLECESLDMPTAKINVKGLFGGHSGEDIDKRRANANKLMGRALNSLSAKYDFRLVYLLGGNRHNAIPRECEAVIASCELESIKQEVKLLEKEIASELSTADANFSLTLDDCALKYELMLTKKDTEKIVFLMSTVADGVLKMCENIDGVVEFSRNLGVVCVDTEKKEANLVFMPRSSKDTQIKASNEEIDAYAKILGIDHILSNAYPAWEPSKESELCDVYSECYRECFGEECRKNVIHAGLECAIIKQLCPALDIISCGALVLDLHSPDEALNIASFERFFTLIAKILEKKI